MFSVYVEWDMSCTLLNVCVGCKILLMYVCNVRNLCCCLCFFLCFFLSITGCIPSLVLQVLISSHLKYPHPSFAPQARYVQAKLSVHDRSLKVATVIESLEMEMELLCLTGVEDQLQADVRPTLEILRNAGIKVWRDRWLYASQ